MKDYYKILGVSKSSKQDEIDKAFRKLAHKYHPDKKGGDVNKFKEVNEAYQVLKDKQKRAQYDAGFGTGGASSGFGGFEGFDFSNAEMNFSGGGNLNDILNSIFKGAMNRGADIQADITITFEESVFGVSKKITIPYRRKSSETIDVQIPAGIASGQSIRYSQKGEPANDSKGQPGDLYIRILVKKSEDFERHGGDIVRYIDLTPSEAILGLEKEIKDVRGNKVKVSIPQLSKEGTHIVIQGGGIPAPAGTGRLVVVCKIVYPKNISKKSKELLEDLQKEGF